jgi:uncharacterized phage infection (PIP) family protein YhgE
VGITVANAHGTARRYRWTPARTGAASVAARRIDAVAEAIDHIAELQSMIAAAVEEQSAANNEISCMLQRAASGTSEIATSASNAANAARDNHDSADQVRSTAGQLTRFAQTLRRRAQAASEGRSMEVRLSDGWEPHEVPQERFVTDTSADTAPISSDLDDIQLDGAELDADAAATKTRRLARRSQAPAISHEPTRGPRTTRDQPHLR